MLDLLVIGAGPTGLAIGVEAKLRGLDGLIVERGPLCGAMVEFPTNMNFFTTRDKLEVAGLPFTIPNDKPSRQQALVYYQGLARHHELPLALYEDVEKVERQGDHFVVHSRHRDAVRQHATRAVALATGYFGHPKVLGVDGEDQPWVHARYREPYLHFAQHVVIVGGGNSACEAALDLWRNHVQVTMVVRQDHLKPTVKYWVKPDVENRIEEGSIDALFEATVERFSDAGEVIVRQRGAERALPCDAAYVLIGYLPDADFERRCGIELDDTTLVPTFDPQSLESNVPGLYVAGTLQAGVDTGRIFIENSRDHGVRIVSHLCRRLGR
jgi:thioredoxin reductase (NADPH)